MLTKASRRKGGSLIRLEAEPLVLIEYPNSNEVFEKNDDGFFSWLDDHTDGYFINCESKPKSNNLVLHRASCSHFDRSPDVHWTRSIKICSTARGKLEEWAASTGDVTLCGTCFG
jgi:hypothetical protein